jgi:hypothetical protein
MKSLLPIIACCFGGILNSAESWQVLPRREIKPRGWMQHQMERNLTSGNLSAYAELRQTGAACSSARCSSSRTNRCPHPRTAGGATIQPNFLP